jgi:hypothetical protein
VRTCGGRKQPKLNDIFAMSIFHLTVKRGSRSENRLSVDKHDYIMRLGRFAQRHDGELVHSESGNMPSWAANDPRKLWVEVDAHERANGTLYHEVEFALPRELAFDQQISAAREAARMICGDQHPYSWGLHEKDGNPHVHLMFSGRMLDGIDRDADQFFKRYNAKNPERGGCRKESSGDARGPEWVKQVRAGWQDIANRHLAAAGLNDRIDHRSHKARGLDEAPGVHLGRHATRLEMRGKNTWRGLRNREAQHLNTSLHAVKSRIKEKEHGQQRPVPGYGVHAGEIHCVESLDRRQQYKRQLLTDHYNAQISDQLAGRLLYVDRQPDQTIIALRDYSGAAAGRVIDKGDRLAAGRRGTDSEILAMVSVSQLKGWKQIQITGSESFKARAYIEAVRAGLAVVGYSPSPELRAQLEKEKKMTDQAGAGGMMALTPCVTAPDPKAAAKRRWEDALRATLEKLDIEHKATKLISLLSQIEQDRKQVQKWLEKVQQERIHKDDLLWEVRHHQVEAGTKLAAMMPLYQLGASEAETQKKEREEERQAQIRREIEAQQQADAIQDQLGKPDLTAEQEEALEQQHRYYLAVADGHDEEEARERAAKKSDALRL